MNGPKILLVSSDKNRRPAFAGTFKGLECQVLSTVLAQDALAALEGFKPDIVLADMNLEDMKSNEFLKKLEAHSHWPNMAFVPYTRFIDYKLINPDLLPVAEEGELAEDALEVLREHLRLVPGEIVVWVQEALLKKNAGIPDILNAAVQILKKISK